MTIDCLHLFEDVLVFQVGCVVFHAWIGRVLLGKLHHPPPVSHSRHHRSIGRFLAIAAAGPLLTRAVVKRPSHGLAMQIGRMGVEHQ